VVVTHTSRIPALPPAHIVSAILKFGTAIFENVSANFIFVSATFENVSAILGSRRGRSTAYFANTRVLQLSQTKY
jgi:hypothetical protein